MRLLVGFIALMLAMAQSAPPAKRCPSIETENLLGQKVALPEALNGHAAILIIGFAHASQSETKFWSTRLEADFHPYSIAILEDVPRLVRGMAAKGIKSSVPDSRKDRFLLAFHGEKELKEAVNFVAPNDAYIALLDRSGLIQWQFHGEVSDATVNELRVRLRALDIQ
jgi:hypothetical protein